LFAIKERNVMNKKTYLTAFFTLVALFLIGIVPALAGGGWSAYLFESTSGELLRVYQDSTQERHSIGLGENQFISSRDIAFNADASRAAYCVTTYPPGTADAPGQPFSTFYLRDLAAETNLIGIEFGSAIGCRTDSDSFNEDYSQIAVSVVNYFPGDPAADTSKPAWQIQILDVATGAILNELNSNSPSVAAQGMILDAPVLPDVNAFDNNQIIFAEVPYGIGGTPSVNAFRWNLADGNLTPEPDGAYNHFGVGSLDATGEKIWTALDPGLPAAQPDGPVGQFNVVMLADSSGEQRVIYHNAEWTPITAKFIDDGQRIAILLFPAYDPNQPVGAQPSKWVALDRAGNVTDLQTDLEYSDIAYAPGGYAFLRTRLPQTEVELVRTSLEYYTGTNMTELWSAEGTTIWEIAWMGPSSTLDNLPAFPTFVSTSNG
jgi:hypothetical protein